MTADTTTLTGLATNAEWRGGVLASDGRIVGIPGKASAALLIDPEQQTTDTISLAGLGEGLWKYAGGVLANNGVIYAIPDRASSVLAIHLNC